MNDNKTVNTALTKCPANSTCTLLSTYTKINEKQKIHQHISTWQFKLHKKIYERKKRMKSTLSCIPKENFLESTRYAYNMSSQLQLCISNIVFYIAPCSTAKRRMFLQTLRDLVLSGKLAFRIKVFPQRGMHSWLLLTCPRSLDHSASFLCWNELYTVTLGVAYIHSIASLNAQNASGQPLVQWRQILGM